MNNGTVPARRHKRFYIMGKRVHIAKKFVVEYADGDGFNWKSEEFKNLLNTLNVSVSGEDYADDWEVQTAEYDKALEYLKANRDAIFNYDSAEETDTEIYNEDVYDSIMALSNKEADDEDAYKTFCLRLDEIVSDMEYFKKKRQKNDDYMHFAAF